MIVRNATLMVIPIHLVHVMAATLPITSKRPTRIIRPMHLAPLVRLAIVKTPGYQQILMETLIIARQISH